MHDVCFRDHDQDEVLRRFLAGNRHTHAEVVGWIRSVIFCRYRRLGEAADDIVQETLYHVLRAVSQPDFRLKKDLRAFVRHVAVARCIELLRRQRTATRHLATNDAVDPEAVPADRPDVTQHLARQEAHRILHDAIARLSFACQEIFRLRLWERLTFDQIARKLNRSAGGMKARFFVCKPSLHEELERLARGHDISLDDFLSSFD